MAPFLLKVKIIQLGGFMSKRFTDTDKWKRPWFSELPDEAKLAWIYILDDCDHRGVWIANFKRISFDLGHNIDQEIFENWFKEKVSKFDDDKYFIQSFVDFQYGELNPENKAHKSIISLINAFNSFNEGQNKDLGSPFQGDKDKDKEQDKDKEKEERRVSIASKREVDLALESIYRSYPRREGKINGMKIAKREINSLEDADLLYEAVNNYREKKKGNDTKFLLLFSTFMNQWRDWLDPETGTVDMTMAKKPDPLGMKKL